MENKWDDLRVKAAAALDCRWTEGPGTFCITKQNYPFMVAASPVRVLALLAELDAALAALRKTEATP